MAARILSGKPVVEALHARIQQVLARRAPYDGPLTLTALLPNDPSAQAYARAIRKHFSTLHLGFRTIEIEDTLDESRLEMILKRLAEDESVTGILALQPLPKGVSRRSLARLMPPTKDVDGVSFEQQGRLAIGSPWIAPSTPLGGLILLQHYGIELAGRHAVVIGRSPVVGRPLALLLLARDATVTICHRHTPDLARLTRQADLLFVAAGQPHLVKPDMVAAGAVVIDFGVSVRDGRLIGDVDPAVAEVASALTPVPGGTGPVTTAVLALNLLRLAGLLEDNDSLPGAP